MAVYFDLETGGLEPWRPNIQLAAVAVDERTWDEKAVFEAKIQFDERRADHDALRLNHYDRNVWMQTARPERDVCWNFSAFLKNFCVLRRVSKEGTPYFVADLVAHNSAFDGPRLVNTFACNEVFLQAEFLMRCSLQAALWYFALHPEEVRPESFALAELCTRFGIPVKGGQAHDALVDVRLAIQLVRALRSRWAAKASTAAPPPA